MSLIELDHPSHPRNVTDRAKRTAALTSHTDQINELLQGIGPRLTAAALGVKNGRTLVRWTQGGPIRAAVNADRLRVLYGVYVALTETYPGAVVEAFLRGSNPELDGRAGWQVLSQEPDPVEAEKQLTYAVEAFLTG